MEGSAQQPIDNEKVKVELLNFPCNYGNEEGTFIVYVDSFLWKTKMAGRNTEVSSKFSRIKGMFVIMKLLLITFFWIISQDVQTAKTQVPKLRLIVDRQDGIRMPYDFMFATLQARDACKDRIIKLYKATTAISDKIKARFIVLENNPPLKKLWEELVKNKKMLQEEEFWNGREVCILLFSIVIY